MKSRRLLRGFTLIELVVVVLILAILAALVVPRVIGQADKAKYAAAQSDLASYSSALNQFRLDCDRYPTSDEGLQALREAPSDVQQKWKGPYVEKDIHNDPWQQPYHYVYPGQGGNKDTFDLYSDGPPGSTDKIYAGQ